MEAGTGGTSADTGVEATEGKADAVEVIGTAQMLTLLILTADVTGV